MTSRRLVGLVAAAALLVPLGACSDSSVMHMRVGQCILMPEDETATTVETTEVFYVTSAEDGDFPGETELNKQAGAQCLEHFKEYVGSNYLTSTIDMTWMIPTKDSWAQKDRAIVCLARSMDRTKLKMSVKDSGL